MVRENQIIILPDEQYFACIPCGERTFEAEERLLQHCRTARVHQGEWCDSCEWLFVSPGALAAHQSDSRLHWICFICELDLDCEGELEDHMATEHSHCYHCQMDFDSRCDHRVKFHNGCDQCDEDFDSVNELLMHKQVHQSRKEKCYSCPRQFKTPSGILIHLESGACESGISQYDIDEWAFDCPQHFRYTNDRDDDQPYHCPECERDVPKVSALFQHVESPACKASYQGSIEKLRRKIATCASRV